MGILSCNSVAGWILSCNWIAELTAGSSGGNARNIEQIFQADGDAMQRLDVAGVSTTAASRQFCNPVATDKPSCNRLATEDARLVKLLKQSGAVLLGKLNLHEFAFGMSGMVSAFGPVKNPWDTERITGGSSSGAAAAVAAGLCVAAIGTDTAGSIRYPSALCGIVGHRPSAVLVSARA